ncbi:MAG TPA: MFS transporter, partial [Candidatus Limnocylindrales bacterium]
MTSTRPSLFRQPDFTKLWSAATVSLFGTQVSQVAIPVVAVLILQASAFEVAVVATLEFLPFLLFTLPAGVWVDRLSRRRILITGDLGRAVMLATIPIAYFLNALTIWQLFVVAFVNGVLTVFFDIADQSYLPTVVERAQLVDANGKLQTSMSTAQVLGQPVGGGIVGLVAAPFALALDAISYVVSALLIFSIRRRERNDPASPAAAV